MEQTYCNQISLIIEEVSIFDDKSLVSFWKLAGAYGKLISHSFNISRDLEIRRLTVKWIDAIPVFS